MSNKGESFLVGIVLGAAVGAVTALLMAPDKGKRTRKKLNRKVRELNEAIEDLYDISKDSVNNFSENVEDNFQQLAKKGRQVISKK